MCRLTGCDMADRNRKGVENCHGGADIVAIGGILLNIYKVEGSAT